MGMEENTRQTQPAAQEKPNSRLKKEYNEPDLFLQQHWEDLRAYIYPYVLEDMKKSERAVLGADIRKMLWAVSDCIYDFAHRYGNRREQLDFIDHSAKKLMLRIRLAIKLKLISGKRQEEIGKRLVVIGKIVGGLKKTVYRGRV